MQHVTTGIRPQFHVCLGKTQCLLNHTGTHGNTRGCVVFRERNVCCSDTEDQRRVDLQMRVFGG